LDGLDPRCIFGRAGTTVVGTSGEVLPRVGSTMDVARERLLAGCPDGYVVLAEEQTAGRGRQGAWECPPGKGLLMSVAFRVSLPARERKLVVIMGAVASVEAVRTSGVQAMIKWPNDVVTAAPSQTLRVRKLGGLLVEHVGRNDAAPAHVLGIGLNVNQGRDELPRRAAPVPTSMRLERGQPFDRNAVCRRFLQELDRWYRRLAMGQSERILARWRRLSCLLGRRVRASVGQNVVEGRVVGIRSTGELIMQDAVGRQLLLSEERTRLLL